MASDTLDRWRKVEDIFHRVLELPAADRAAALHGLCEGDPGIEEDVASLLAAEVSAAAGRGGEPADPWIGRQLGAFRVERLIGRGGMGAVYLSRRVEGGFDQAAAAKIVFTRLMSSWLRERFLVERQVLASLNHPNIARLIGGGLTEEGEPFLLMEYIEGERLDVHCDRGEAGVEDVLRLIIQLCAAVSYAHRHLVIHRDLKPGNVLVTPDGQVKLLDFGTAKLLAEDAKAEGTRLGFRAFTPEYASPEQLFGEAVSTSTDVYSLGVILYRLLTGQLPYEIPESAAGLVRTLYDTEPVTPSDAVTRLAPAAQPGKSEWRVQLQERIRGDLDAIVLRALRPDPADRYASPDDLAADLERYLDHRPVLARQGSLRYRAAKWARRHVAGIAASVLIASALVGGVWASARQGRIAAEEERRAREGYAEVRKLARLLLVDFYDEVKQVPGSADVQRRLVNQAQTFLDRLDRESRGDADTLFDLTDAYRKSAGLLGNPYEENLGDAKAALESYERGLAAAERLRAVEPNSIRAAHATALVRRGMAETLFSVGRAPEAIVHGRAAAAEMARLAALPNASVETISEAASSFDALGDQYGLRGAGSMGNVRDAEAAYRRAAEFHEAALARDPRGVRPLRGLAVQRMKVAGLYAESDPDRAVREFEASLAYFERIPAEERTKAPIQRVRAMVETRYGAALAQNGREAASIPHLEEGRRVYESVLLLDADDQRARFDVATSNVFLGTAYSGLGRHADALAARDRVRTHLEILLKKAPDNLVTQGHAAENEASRARTLETLGRMPEAEQAWQAALKGIVPVAENKAATPNDLNRAAAVLLEARPERLRDPAKAVMLARRSVELSGGSQAAYLFGLGKALAAAGNASEARAVLEKARTLTAPASRLRSEIDAKLRALG